MVVAPPSRLLTLIGEALRWQKSLNLIEEGSKYDLIKGVSMSPNTEADEPAIECYTQIKVKMYAVHPSSIFPLNMLFFFLKR